MSWGRYIKHRLMHGRAARTQGEAPINCAQVPNQTHYARSTAFGDRRVHRIFTRPSPNYVISKKLSTQSIMGQTPHPRPAVFRATGASRVKQPYPLSSLTAPVSHQKPPQRNATNAIEIEPKYSKINEPDRYPPAHNGLVAGSSLAGPAVKSGGY